MLIVFLVVMLIVGASKNCLKVKVLGYDRPALLRKLLESLLDNISESLDVGKKTGWLARVPIDISIDGPPVRDQRRKKLLEQSCRIARSYRRRDRRNIRVVCHQKHLGILGQWANAWPIHKSQPRCHAALILEDDVVLSRAVASFAVLAHFIDDKLILPDDVYGLALQRPQWQLGVSETGRWRRLDLPLGPLIQKTIVSLFTYPAFGTWGQIIFANHWRNFLCWLLDGKASR